MTEEEMMYQAFSAGYQAARFFTTDTTEVREHFDRWMNEKRPS